MFDSFVIQIHSDESAWKYEQELECYEEFERESPFNDPMPIYPDFIKEPHYTAEGIPLVTAMQNICEFYNGKNDEDSCCADCVFFQKSEELFGFCNCFKNKRSHEERADVRNE